MATCAYLDHYQRYGLLGMLRIVWNAKNFLDVILACDLTSISSRSVQLLIWMRPGWDRDGIGMAMSVGLGV